MLKFMVRKKKMDILEINCMLVEIKLQAIKQFIEPNNIGHINPNTEIIRSNSKCEKTIANFGDNKKKKKKKIN